MACSGTVEVINHKGCSRLFYSPLSNSSLSTSASPSSMAAREAIAPGPFSGLIICVTGLSKEVRKEVMVAAERLGGQYSPSLHPACTHLVVQSFGGRKFEHAVKHGVKNGLLVVTLAWFVDSVRKNVRMREALYDARNQRGIEMLQHEPDQLPGCCIYEKSWASTSSYSKGELILSRKVIHIDANISSELKKKVADAALAEGATCTDQWFAGCRASHVVCEGPHLGGYIGHASNIVTPLWILKSVKEKQLQKLVHLSSDLARHVAAVLENMPDSFLEQDCSDRRALTCACNIKTLDERREIVEMAKTGLRNRRSRHNQSYQAVIRPITPSNLLDSICWSVGDPTSSASIYTDRGDAGDNMDLDASFRNLSRPLKESEKSAMILKTHLFTILFPVDRHGEPGPRSRTFFSDGGFTCVQILDLIYSFYQEKMTEEEMNVAIHADSEQAEALRSFYASAELSDPRSEKFKRIEFLGTRRSFEILKRVGGENFCSVYELVLRS
ncbi:BRCT domain DNA repair protein isoform X1 [Wolffia australiana]